MEGTSVYVAGIDLGTTNSCISVFKNNRVVMVPNASGQRTTPSMVAFTANGRVIGTPAKNSAARFPRNTIYEVKRLIGHGFDDPVVQADKEGWPFTIIPDEHRRPLFEVDFMDQKQTFTPEQISSMIVEHLVQQASEFVKFDIKDIVITVPAYFNDNQRQATKDAGLIAGYNVLSVLNEPTAAAIAYGFDNVEKDMNILVYDLGGGTFDVTVLQIVTSNDGENKKNFRVIATDGDTHLGGCDFDRIVADMIIKDIAEETGDSDFEKDPKTMVQIKQAAESAKIQLSYTESTNVDILDTDITITRQRFNDACRSLFIRTIEIIDSVLVRGELRREDIDQVVMIGGSSHIPYIHDLLGSTFSKDKICETINADEAVSQGATLKAVQLALSHQSSGKGDVRPEVVSVVIDEGDADVMMDDDDTTYDVIDIRNINITDVVPLTLGIKTATGKLSKIIPRDTPIPCMEKRNYVTSKDNQSRMKIRIYQGDRELAEENNQIGNLIVDNIPLMPRGQASVDVVLSMDSNCILTVTATELATKQVYTVTFDKEETNLSEEQVIQMKQKAFEMRQFDQDQLRKLTLINELQALSYKIDKLATDKEELMNNELVDYLATFRPGLVEVIKLRLENEESMLKNWKEECEGLVTELEELKEGDDEQDEQEAGDA